MIEIQTWETSKAKGRSHPVRHTEIDICLFCLNYSYSKHYFRKLRRFVILEKQFRYLSWATRKKACPQNAVCETIYHLINFSYVHRRGTA